jgi:hypothetical protein
MRAWDGISMFLALEHRRAAKWRDVATTLSLFGGALLRAADVTIRAALRYSPALRS